MAANLVQSDRQSIDDGVEASVKPIGGDNDGSDVDNVGWELEGDCSISLSQTQLPRISVIKLGEA